MFQDCSSLNYIKMLATDISATTCLYFWVSGVSNNGTFVKHPNMNDLPTGTSGIPNGWEVIDDESVNYLTIEALEDGLTVSLSNNACEYSSDLGVTWQQLNANSNTQSINTGDILLFRGELIPNETYGIGTFTISKKCNLKGNCMSMLFKDNVMNTNLTNFPYAFKFLFRKTPVVHISKDFLPATTLSIDCYRGLFYECSYLVNSPDLPALIMEDSCYRGMFFKCTSLTDVSDLPSITLADNCYWSMYQGCTSLQNVQTVLPATILKTSCYSSMYNGSGLLNPPIINATTIATSSCAYMFQSCNSLTESPVLLSEKMEPLCYQYMFDGCKNLQYIKMLATDISATECLNCWVRDVSNTGTFVKNPNMNDIPTGLNGIPYGWTVELDEL